MKPKFRLSILAGILLGPAMLTAAVFGLRWSDLSDAIPIGGASALVGANDGSSKMSDTEARDRLTSEATTRLAESLGSTHLGHDGEREFPIAPTMVDGHAITLSDLELKDFRFSSNTKSVSSSINSGASFGTNRNVWIGAWERTNVTVEGWDDPAIVRVTVVIDDRDGNVLGASVEQVSPKVLPTSP